MDSSTAVLTVLEARPDWITATCPVGDRALALRNAGMFWAEQSEEAGDRPRRWKQLGYQGFACGGVRWGEGKEGVMVQLSGPVAGQHDQELAHAADHWSRVDYCVTVLDETALIHPTRDYRRSLAGAVKAGTELSKVTLIETLGGGSSIYLGSRASARYLRCYDKGSENPREYSPGAWRWEVEYKRELSEEMQGRHQLGFGTAMDISCQVAAEFARHRLIAPWPAVMQGQLPTLGKRLRDIDVTLYWLGSQVGPAARWAARQRGWDVIMSTLMG